MPYEPKLIAMIPDMVLNATVYAHLTQLLEISNYRMVSAEIGIDIAISTKNYAYSINSVRFVVAQLFHVFCRSELAVRSRDSEIAPTIFWMVHCTSPKLISFPHLTLKSQYLR